MLTKEQLERLSNFKCVSWAIWSKDFNQADCLESQPRNIFPFILQHIDHLKPAVVFLGLNRSRNAPITSFENFHAMRHLGDYTLKSYIQDGNLTNLHGGYMTDIDDRDVGSDGSQVCIMQADIEHLMQQLDILEQPSFKVICFGVKAFSELAKRLGYRLRNIGCRDFDIRTFRAQLANRALEVFGVCHYSQRVRKNWPKLKAQLACLNAL